MAQLHQESPQQVDELAQMIEAKSLEVRPVWEGTAEKAAAEAEVARLRAAVAAKEAELVEFKEKVVKAARKGKIEHDWCNEINRIVEHDLGLEWDDERYTAEVTVRFRITATVNEDVEVDSVLSMWVQSSLSAEDEGDNTLYIRLDEESHDVEYSRIEIRVDSAENV